MLKTKTPKSSVPITTTSPTMITVLNITGSGYLTGLNYDGNASAGYLIIQIDGTYYMGTAGTVFGLSTAISPFARFNNSLIVQVDNGNRAYHSQSYLLD